ncbi:hypothetical protein NLJ89_g7673 [Agrocybe chaxingu]|uniref:DUF6532 domain-containing protein n=1 Tax=Agrocybe chaxingu TaxID=84603 RepID=A0A9W8MV82_9AGAR|nr:hypothetical protein NLJ89_g7673 [Agrocybe chaxingu]
MSSKSVDACSASSPTLVGPISPDMQATRKREKGITFSVKPSSVLKSPVFNRKKRFPLSGFQRDAQMRLAAEEFRLRRRHELKKAIQHRVQAEDEQLRRQHRELQVLSSAAEEDSSFASLGAQLAFQLAHATHHTFLAEEEAVHSRILEYELVIETLKDDLEDIRARVLDAAFQIQNVVSVCKAYRIPLRMDNISPLPPSSQLVRIQSRSPSSSSGASSTDFSDASMSVGNALDQGSMAEHPSDAPDDCPYPVFHQHELNPERNDTLSFLDTQHQIIPFFDEGSSGPALPQNLDPFSIRVPDGHPGHSTVSHYEGDPSVNDEGYYWAPPDAQTSGYYFSPAQIPGRMPVQAPPNTFGDLMPPATIQQPSWTEMPMAEAMQHPLNAADVAGWASSTMPSWPQSTPFFSLQPFPPEQLPFGPYERLPTPSGRSDRRQQADPYPSTSARASMVPAPTPTTTSAPPSHGSRSSRSWGKGKAKASSTQSGVSGRQRKASPKTKAMPIIKGRIVRESIVLGRAFYHHESPLLDDYKAQARAAFKKYTTDNPKVVLNYDELEPDLLGALTDWRSSVKCPTRILVADSFGLKTADETDPKDVKDAIKAANKRIIDSLRLSDKGPNRLFANNPANELGERWATPLVFEVLSLMLFGTKNSVGFEDLEACGPPLKLPLLALALTMIWECLLEWEYGTKVEAPLVYRAEGEYEIIHQQLRDYESSSPQLKKTFKKLWRQLLKTHLSSDSHDSSDSDTSDETPAPKDQVYDTLAYENTVPLLPPSDVVVNWPRCRRTEAEVGTCVSHTAPFLPPHSIARSRGTYISKAANFSQTLISTMTNNHAHLGLNLPGSSQDRRNTPSTRSAEPQQSLPTPAPTQRLPGIATGSSSTPAGTVMPLRTLQRVVTHTVKTQSNSELIKRRTLEVGAAAVDQAATRQSLYDDEATVARVRDSLAARKEEEIAKRPQLPDIIPGFKAYALNLAISPKVDNTIKAFTPLLPPPHAVRQPEEKRSLDRKGEKELGELEWLAVAKAAEERMRHHHGDARADALASHHQLVTDLGCLHVWEIALEYDSQQRDLWAHYPSHDISSLDRDALTVITTQYLIATRNNAFIRLREAPGRVNANADQFS